MCKEIEKNNARTQALFVCWHGTGRSPNNAELFSQVTNLPSAYIGFQAPELWLRTLRLKIPTAPVRTEIAASVADALLHNEKGPLQAVFCFLDEVIPDRFGPPENWRFTYIFQQQAKALGIPVHYMERYTYSQYSQLYLSYQK